MDGELKSEDLLNDLRRWVSAEALKIDNVETYDLKVYGADDKAEHYGSDIAFVDISAKNFDGEKKEYNLVIKYGQRNSDVRERLPITLAFEREINIYAKIMPLYYKLQQENNLPLFSSAPKCYFTKFLDSEEVIILENLKKIGYTIHNRKIPMNLDHIKLVLEAYAEWHALSFALQDQNNEEYLTIVKSWDYSPLDEFANGPHGGMLDVSEVFLYEILEGNGETDLLRKYKEKIGNIGLRKRFIDLYGTLDSQSVVLHGDCWNNNFLFKYEDNESPNPGCIKVALLDFQISSLRSPVFDLTHFIYSVASEQELEHFRELIDYYYEHLSKHLRSLGSNPENIFSYLDLTRHLRKYSAFGALFNPMLLLFALVEEANAPDFGKDVVMDKLKSVIYTEEYKSRVFAVAKHFVEFEF